MKTKLLRISATVLFAVLLLSSCAKNDEEQADSPSSEEPPAVTSIETPVVIQEPGIEEAAWELYPNTPLMELVSNQSEQVSEETNDLQEAESDDTENVISLEDTPNTKENNLEITLDEGWTECSYYIYDGKLTTRNHLPYTLTVSTSDEKDGTSQNNIKYIFLEYDEENNIFSALGAFENNIRTYKSYETVENITYSKNAAENLLIELFRLHGFYFNLPDENPLEEEDISSATRRYNHLPINPHEMCLSEFPEIPLFEILSRFDDAYGDIFKSIEGSADEVSSKEYAFVSFEVTAEYDWKKSSHLNEFTDGTDNTQPHTYSAVYTAKDDEGITLIAEFNIFAEIEPRHSVLSICESVFTITYDEKVVFEDVQTIDDTILFLDTIVKYHPEDVVVTPSPEEVQIPEEELAADEAEEADEAENLTESEETGEQAESENSDQESHDDAQQTEKA